MTSSDGRQAAGRSAPATAPSTGTSGGRAGADADGEQPDPWFGPGRKPAGPAGDAEPETAQWFLRAGRAGLLPGSISEDEAPAGGAGGQPSAGTGSAPPWAAEEASAGAAAPPPWETGPWPGPGGERRAGGRAGTGSGRAGAQADDRDPGWPASATREADPPVPALPDSGAATGGQPDHGGSRLARRVLITGLLPLVIPGLIAGFAGFRRGRPGEAVRRASVAAIAASLAWAVIIVVIVIAAGPGGPAATCSYPPAVRQAYSKAMTDLSASAPAATRSADLSLAVSRANAAAAATGQIQVRNALFGLAGDLEQARADVTAQRPVPAALRSRLTADGTALTGGCAS